jgi:hypothetical protein
MKSIAVLYLFILCCVFSRCNNSREDAKRILRISLANHGYAVIPYVLNEQGDTLFDGIGKYYTEKGDLIDLITFINSQKNGWHIHYNSGKIYSKIMFLNDTAEGKGYIYNVNGKVEEENYYQDNKVRVGKFFDSSGRVSLINFYDGDRAFYAISYDSIGKKIKESGVVFAYNFESNQKLDSVKVNKLFEIKIPVVILPQYITNIEIARFNSRNELYEVIDSIPINNYFALFKTLFKETGLQKIGIAGELRETNGKVIKRDTLYQRINVIE